ncbi:MAG: metal-sensing transcriptional repressor [Lachnospiraceae bacterium]
MRADKKKVERLLKTARGQLDGIMRMMEEDRYCIDVSNQLLATQAILTKVNKEILRAHMECCVKDAILSEDADEKIEEVLSLLEKMMK